MAYDATSIAALIVSLGSLTFTVLKGRYDQIVGVKPALVFVYAPEHGWQIQNIGAGPALNIVIASLNPAEKIEKWKHPVRIPPLKKDGTFGIHWNPHAGSIRFGAMYEDMWKRKYTTICQRDLNTIRRGWRLGGWSEEEITAEWRLRKGSVIESIDTN